jgi:transcriptional regulator with XRE-family HTH domain
MTDNKKRPNPIDIHVGSRIRLRRNMIAMSQEKLGERLGITFQQIQKYEKGTNRVGASRLQAIAGILSVPVEYFFQDAPGDGQALSGFGEEAQLPMVPDFMSSTETLQLSRAFMKIRDAKLRRKILDLVKTLASDESEPS